MISPRQSSSWLLLVQYLYISYVSYVGSFRRLLLIFQLLTNNVRLFLAPFPKRPSSVILWIKVYKCISFVVYDLLGIAVILLHWCIPFPWHTTWLHDKTDKHNPITRNHHYLYRQCSLNISEITAELKSNAAKIYQLCVSKDKWNVHSYFWDDF
jgi:hypothetical protein